MAAIRIGIGGWTYPPWRGVFYPDKLAAGEGARICVAPAQRDRDQRDLLRPAEPKSWETWENVVPDGFQFAVKGSRYCVKPLEARRGRGRHRQFLRAGLRGARAQARTDPVAIRDMSKRFDRDDIAAFIDLLPETLDGMSLRHAIEPRHESFKDERFFELCRARNIAVVSRR